MATSVKGIQESDLIGTNAVDFEERVDVRRLRRERLQRLQDQIGKSGLSGLLLFDPVNVRYALGVRSNEIFALRNKTYHALVPREGEPVLFNGTGLEPTVLDGTLEMRDVPVFEYWQAGTYTREATARWAAIVKSTVKEMGMGSEPIGLDRGDPVTIKALETEGLTIDDALEPVARARVIKTQDEVALIRQACAIADVALARVKMAIRPGVRETELFAIMADTNLRHGGERMDCMLLAAGGNTLQWLKRTSTDRIVRHGDLVAMDTDMAGPMGYFADISRTYLCGDGKPNPEQLESYKRAYDFLYKSIPLFTVGASFQEIAERVPEVPDEYKANRYSVLAHGVGMSDEWPALYFTDTSTTGFGNVPGVLEENMFMTMEASFGKENGREQVKLEEQLLITANGPEIISQAPFDWRFLD